MLAVAFATFQIPVRAAPGDEADLSITGSASSAGVKVGHDITFSLRALNNGPDAATNVAVEVVLDLDLTIQAADAPGGTCNPAATVVVCSLDSLAAGGSFKVAVRATTTASGPTDTIGAVESDTSDSVPANNTVTFTTHVGPESSPCDLWGTAGNDRIRSGAQGEVVCGRNGNDRLLGRGGRDRLVGGAGEDVLIGGAGRDRLSGGPGRDRCRRAGGDVRRGCP